MRRRDISTSVDKILTAIKRSNIREALNKLGLDKNSNNIDIIRALQEFMKFSYTFDENEKRICEIFNINSLDDPKIWEALISNENVNRDDFFKLQRGLFFTEDFLPKLMLLFEQEGVNLFDNKKAHKEYQNKKLLTVILPEDNNLTSTPERLIFVLDSVRSFYEVLSEVQGSHNNELSILAIDSGSDKSFDFLGTSKIIESVKELIIGLWDRVFFHKEKKMSERLDLITNLYLF